MVYRTSASDVLSFAKVKLSGQVPDGIKDTAVEFCGVKAKVALWATTKDDPMEQDFNIYVAGLAPSVTKSELLVFSPCAGHPSLALLALPSHHLPLLYIASHHITSYHIVLHYITSLHCDSPLHMDHLPSLARSR